MSIGCLREVHYLRHFEIVTYSNAYCAVQCTVLTRLLSHGTFRTKRRSINYTVQCKRKWSFGACGQHESVGKLIANERGCSDLKGEAAAREAFSSEKLIRYRVGSDRKQNASPKHALCITLYLLRMPLL